MAVADRRRRVGGGVVPGGPAWGLVTRVRAARVLAARGTVVGGLVARGTVVGGLVARDLAVTARGCGLVQLPASTETDSMTTSVRGRSIAPTGVAAILSTTSRPA